MATAHPSPSMYLGEYLAALLAGSPPQVSRKLISRYPHLNASSIVDARVNASLKSNQILIKRLAVVSWKAFELDC